MGLKCGFCLVGCFACNRATRFFATLWVVFAVKNDLSRSGKTVVPTKGYLRLMLEFLFFRLAPLALFDLKFRIKGIVFSILVILHYAFGYKRIIWLLKQ